MHVSVHIGAFRTLYPSVAMVSALLDVLLAACKVFF